jgi:phosphatidylglycerophosphate synthase
MKVSDLSDYFWQDVDTPEALHHAQEYLFSTLRKPTDGWISSHFNRRISIAITRLLIRTNLSANHVTGLITLIGIFSGVFVSSGRYLDVAIGGILFQLASILDGCDGEMAKLRMTSSKMGEWLDTISDNLTYFAFLIGVSMGAHRQIHGVFEVFEAAFMFAGLAFCLILMFYYLIYYTNSGTLVVIQKEITEEENKQKSQEGIFHWLSKIRFMMKRDFFAVCFMILALANQLPVILHLSVIGVNLSWMVLLAFKKEIFRMAPSRKMLDSSTQK